MGVFDTYLNFINKSFLNKPVKINYDEAIRLYKYLLDMLKSPYVNTDHIEEEIQVIQPNPQPRHQPPVQNSLFNASLDKYTPLQLTDLLTVFI